MKKRKISFLLVFVMVVTMLPMSAYGDIADTKTIFITVSQEGLIENQKNKSNPMARVPIEVPSGAKLDTVIDKVHKDYHEDGQDAYSESGGFYTKFWGVETYNIGYFLNGRITENAANDTDVSHGDEVDAFIYTDWQSDKYARFENRELRVTPGQRIDLSLLGHRIFDKTFEEIEGAELLLAGKKSDLVTDASGQVSFWLAKEGSYYISATMPKDSAFAITAPICQIEVRGPELSSADIKEKIKDDAESMELRGIEDGKVKESVGTLNLPSLGKVNQSKISWTSSNPSVVSNKGEIIRTSSKGQATLTATLEAWGEKITKDFDLEVPAISDKDIEKSLDKIVDEFTPENLSPVEFSPINNSNFLDENILTKAQYIADKKIPGSTVSFTSTSPAISYDGTINYGEEDVEAEIDFTIARGGKEKKILLKLLIPAHKTTKEEALEAKWLDFNFIKGKNSSEDLLKTDLILPKEDPKGNYTEIEWSTDNNEVLEISRYATNRKFKGKITRPEFGQEPVQINLKAKIKPGIYWDYGMAPPGPKPNPAYKEKNFTLTVVPVTKEELADAQILLEEAIDLFELNKLVIRGTREKADLENLTYSVNGLPYNWNYVDGMKAFKEEYRAIDVQWSSENPGISEVGEGAVIRRTDKDQKGDILLTLSYNGGKAVKRFPAVVKAFTKEDAQAENNILESIAEALNFHTIKGTNIYEGEVSENLQKKTSALYTEEGIEFTNSKKYHHIGANISWTSNNEDVIDSNLKVKRPKKDTKVILTASLTSPKYSNCPGVKAVKKTITLTVAGTDENPLAKNIIESYGLKDKNWWGKEANWWHAVGMSGHLDLIEEDSVQAFVNKTINELEALDMKDSSSSSTNASKLAGAINAMSALGYDASSLWTLKGEKINAVDLLKSISIEDAKKGWYSTVAPYVLKAYKQGDYSTQDKENEHIKYLLAELENESNWEWGVDTPAMILHGLVDYYDRPNVKTKVDKAVSKISGLQGKNGSFGSSNTDAMVIIALSGLGINVDTDPRFIKEENSLLDGLYLYELSTKDGFAYQVKDIDKGVNDMATSQGLIALLAAEQVSDTARAYDPFDFKELAKKPAHATKTNEKDPRPDPSQPPVDENIKLSFTLKGDGETWISSAEIRIKEGARVYDVFEKALREKGYSFQSTGNNYIVSITNPAGEKLAEFDKGPNSGWMFKVNGSLATSGAGDIKIAKNDSIELFYSRDWTKEEDSLKIQGDGSGKLVNEEIKSEVLLDKEDGKPTKAVISLSSQVKDNTANVRIKQDTLEQTIKNLQEEAKKNNNEKDGISVEIKLDTKDTKATNLSVDLEKLAVDTLIKAGAKELFINSPIATMKVNLETLKTIQKTIEGDVNFSAKKVDNNTLTAEVKSLAGNRPVFDFTIRGEKGEKVSDFGESKISIAIPYALDKDEKAENLAIYYISDEGEIEEIQNSTYDKENEALLFKTNHFSLFAVGYKESPSFKDIEGHWAKKDIEFVIGRKLFFGLSDSEFSPNLAMTRGMFVTVLGRLAQADITSYKESSFLDVKSDVYYMPYIEWAKNNNIVSGVGQEVFAPESPISREQVAVIIDNYSKVKDLNLPEVYGEKIFADDDKISGYARKSLNKMQRAGIISGKSNNKVDPQGRATRAEISAILKRFIEIVENK